MNSENLKKIILETGFVSCFYHLEEIDSTNTFIGGKDIPADTFVIADFQAKGKGRFDRTWLSEKSSNLTFSIKKKFDLSPAENNLVLFYFSYHLYNSIKLFLQKHFPDVNTNELHIKWPNDILFGWKKLSGILIEIKPISGIYIIGIGINCNQIDFPDELNAVSLAQITKSEINKTALLKTIINELSANIHDLEEKKVDLLFDSWRNSTKMIHMNCSFIDSSGNLNNGKIIDLNRNGSISIKTEQSVLNFISGEIRITSLH